MGERKDIREVYFFKNTCYRCFNDFVYPSLGDFSYGELIFQTSDGQNFVIATLINNKSFDIIRDTLKDIDNKKCDPQNVLAKLADPINGQEFTNETLCPICGHKQRLFSDDIKTTTKELAFATWENFESLSRENQVILITEIVNNEI